MNKELGWSGRGVEFAFPRINEISQPCVPWLAIGINAGNGHASQGLQVASNMTSLGYPTAFKELIGWIAPYASQAEKKLIKSWEWFNRVGLTQFLASKLS
ncbi:hypothetical protein A3D77_06710 [Candidatus Gottesmanbacteria bacterium RIFCSPHIGHO2_02_FULL_39_11]|uniref:Uncharacterized protein n=1 Tax=Candidatus Gottesmanbacteria bacterium RIFCSPHIGHO2_02_FULL_39_11 TaxID=1798382 RepID=A0A1F5ZSU0_9BACT|nr:MAG: hypothetical protein A3D77_06710 [Candidatus Gottesmanbacteria bacterium RIFCSPHIGHO2_02_FULL_39_11]